jgi:Protein of unknown function (DUF973)
MWFGVLQLVGLVAGLVGYFAILGTFSASFSTTFIQNPTPAEANAVLVPFFRDLAILSPVVASVQIASLVILAMGLRDLNRADKRFSVPSSLTIVELIGSLVVIAASVPLFLYLPNLFSQLASSTTTTSLPPGFFSAFAPVAAYFVLIAIGGILTFVGLIGGQILGVWRVGSKYNGTLLKLGAIFAIIPVLDFVAPVLVLVGAKQAKNSLSVPS